MTNLKKKGEKATNYNKTLLYKYKNPEWSPIYSCHDLLNPVLHYMYKGEQMIYIVYELDITIYLTYYKLLGISLA
jgi:hypothetical protein